MIGYVIRQHMSADDSTYLQPSKHLSSRYWREPGMTRVILRNVNGVLARYDVNTANYDVCAVD